MKLKILVTGGSGFLGSHIADKLSESGHQVTIFDVVKSPFLQKDQRMIIGDITDAEQVEKAVRGMDMVFHFAALADIDEARIRPVPTMKINVFGTLNALEASRKEKVKRFVLASSAYVYSETGSFYRVSKQAAEGLVEEFSREYGLPFTIIRYGTLYGRRCNPNNRIWSLLSQALKGKAVYHGTGEEVREFIHVEDAARLTGEILEKKFENRHIMITGADKMTYRELLEMIREILPNKPEIVFKPQSEKTHYRLTPYSFNRKWGQKFEANPRIDIGQGLLDCLEAIQHENREPQKISRAEGILEAMNTENEYGQPEKEPGKTKKWAEAKDLLLRGLRAAQLRMQNAKTAESFVFFPLIQKKEDLEDLLNRSHWYFPKSAFSEPRVSLPVSEQLFHYIRDAKTLSAPKNQEPFVKPDNRIAPVRTRNRAELEDLLKQSDGILLWKAGSLEDIPDALFNLRRIWIVDPDYLKVTEARNYIRAFNATIPEETYQKMLETWQKNFEALVQNGKRFPSASIFLPETDWSQFPKNAFSKTFRLASAGLLLDEKAFQKIRPQVIAFGDFALHLGPSRFASRFRKQLLQECKKGGTAVTRADVLPLLLAHYPELRNRTIGIPLKRWGSFHIPSGKDFFLRFSRNSLSLFLLPVAAALSKKILVPGGKEGKTRQAPKNRSESAELEKTAIQTHPAFFNGNQSEESRALESRDTKEFISFAEASGCSVSFPLPKTGNP